ncbi:MAG: ABC transporter ATP-binding protein [Candidatus Aminicenantes bacterium]|nr:ABC transporter ATP-binding protein [Candidatus Aminicenantes bacterium]
METIKLNKIKKTYYMGDVKVHALRGVNLGVKSGEFLAVMGASGSGKSTLMNIIGCLDELTEGSYFLDGIHVNKLDQRQLADIRNRKIGFVFQGYNLLARTTALENVELPLLYDRSGQFQEPRKRAVEALERVGLGDRLDHEPNQLSGGQQQRVAIARALVNEPSIILADEPTGNLDSKTSIEVMTVFQDLNRQGITIVLVTHEANIALYSKRVVVLQDGLKIKDEPVLNRHSAVEDLHNFVEVPVVFSNGEIEQEVTVK